MNVILEDLTDLKFSIITEKIKKAFNSGNYYEIPNILDNFNLALKIKEPQHDAWGYCFALITLDENEDTSKTDETFLKSKLDNYNSNGLTFITVKSEVENFIKAFPLTYTVYRLKSEGLKTLNY
jgi:hypothetical protein